MRAVPRFVLVTLLGVVSSGIGVYAFVQGKVTSSRPPPPMSGDLNVAVARFSAFDDSGDPVAEETAWALADSVFRYLEPRLTALKDAGFEVQTRPPAATGTVTAWPTADRARQLQALSDKARADIVVAAEVVNGGGHTTVIPELFLAERKLGGALELGGYHQLASAGLNGDPDSNPVLRRELRDQLLVRTRGIARLLVGLGFYNQRRFSEAADAFNTARQDWTDPDGRKLLDLLLGNAAGKQGQYDGARQHYQRALAADSGYGRARLGLAELVFQHSRRSCERGKVNAAGLRLALRRYQDVLRAAEQPPSADLPAKVAFGLGRIYLCLSQAETADDWAQAESQFRTVISEFDRGNQRLQQLAAEAYAGLGLALLPPQGAPHAEAQYRQAAQAYQQAIQLSLDAERQGAFFGTLGHIDQRLGDAAHACDAYQKAAALDPHNAARYMAERNRLPGCT